MELTNSFPTVDVMVKKIKDFDYVKLKNDVIDYSITVYAVVVAVSSYLWTAFQLWWDDNGEATQVNIIRFVVNLVDIIAAICYTIPEIYRWLKLNASRCADYIFFQYIFA